MKFAGFYWVNRNFFKILNVALLCGASKGSMKALKNLNFYFNTTFRNPQDVKG